MSHRAYLYNVQDPAASQKKDIMVMEWGYEVPLMLQPMLVSGGYLANSHYNEDEETEGSALFYDAVEGLKNLQRFHGFIETHMNVLVNDPQRFLQAKAEFSEYLSKLKHPYFLVDMWDVFNMDDVSHQEQASVQMEHFKANNAIFTAAMEADDPQLLLDAVWEDINPSFKDFKEILNYPNYNYGWECIWNVPPEEPVPEAFEDNGLWGLKDENGDVLLHAQFNEIFAFDESGKCVAVTNGKYGYLDKSGTWVIPQMYDDAYDFEYSNVTMVKLGEKMGLINLQNVPVTEFVYDDIRTLEAGSYYNVLLNGLWGVIDAEGKIVMPVEQQQLLEDGYGFYYSAITGRFVKKIFTTAFEFVGEYPKDAVNLVLNRYLHIKPHKNSRQNILFDGAIKVAEGFDKINVEKSFQNLLVIRKGKQYGVLGMQQQKFLLPIEYDSISDSDIYTNSFDDNIVVVKKGNLVGLFQGGGDNEQWLLPLSDFENIQLLRNGYFGFKKDGLWSLSVGVDNIVMPYQFTDLFPKSGYPGIAFVFENDELFVLHDDELIEADMDDVKYNIQNNRHYPIFDKLQERKLGDWLKRNG